MTKFILHGGYVSAPCQSNDNYFKEIISSVAGPMKVLIVYFAVEKDRWQEELEKHQKLFLTQAKNKQIEFALASEDSKEFIRQIKDNDVVFIRGGSTLMLKNQLDKIANFSELIRNKVVAGSSAGAIVFAKYYYSNGRDQISHGLDILHVKIITHYLSTGEYAATSGPDKLKMLEDYKEKLPVYAIPETEFIVVEK
jgi:peptidase E